MADKVNIPISGDFQLIAIDVFDSETEIEPRTKSRYNLRDFIVVMDLLIHIFHKGALGADSDLTIIIPYAERRSKYVRALIELAAEECIRWSDMIKVAQLAPCREEFNACSFFYIYIANSPQRPGLEQIQRIGASVTMEIIGSPVAPKVVFEICVRDRRNLQRGLWHPVNLVHRALLEFDLHAGPHVQKREVSDLVCTSVFCKNISRIHLTRLQPLHSAQYMKSLMNFAAKKGVEWRDMVKVATIDSMQGII